MNAAFKAPNVEMILPTLLVVAEENPRSNETIDFEKIATLADNIATIGVLTPLVAYKDGEEYHVTAGGRRLRAVQLLIEDGRWTDAQTVPVTVMDEGEAIRAGDAEQLSHEIMSDLDTIKVFARPGYSEKTDADLAKLVGRSTQYVKQRRAILDLPEKAKDALFAGEITVSQAAGLTYWVEDPEGLEDALEDCIHNPRMTGNDLRNAFERRARPWDDHPFSKIVSPDEYIAAGGTFQEDLFSDNRFIMSPGILTDLAEKAAQRITEERFPNALEVAKIADLPSHARHSGITDATEEEEDRWDDIMFDWPRWEDDERIREEIAEGDDPEGDLANYEEWLALKKKLEPTYPDDLTELLIVGWSLSQYGDQHPVNIREHILPTDEAAIAKLIERGYLEPEPEEVPFEEGGEGEEPQGITIAASLADRIKRIKAHCVRQHLAKTPNAVFEEYLLHIATPSYYEASFAYRLDPFSHLNDTDPEPVYSAAWEKAQALIEDNSQKAVRALKPAEQRSALMVKILECLRCDRLPVEVTADMLRSYIRLDARFFKAYKKHGMIEMLAAITDANPASLENQKAGALAEMLENQFTENKDWLPAGF